MTKNLKGGKAYKKTKHSEDGAIYVERTDEQMYGRVVKVLGGMNVKVFCNDNKERVCHIRGKMRRRVFLREGDIIILSLRDFSTTNDQKNLSATACGGEGSEKGDVIDKCDPKFFSLLRKDPTTNPKLFIETSEKHTLEEGGGFVFNDGANEVSDNEGDTDEITSSPNKRDNIVRHPVIWGDDNTDEVDVDDI